MDYEQRYKEALDEAKAIHKAIKQDLKPVIEQIFPELKESDDDRIRKELIKLLRNLFNNYSYFIKDPFYTECINWLEKQCKQEITDKIEPKFNLYDWVVTDKGDVVQIGAVNNGYYTLCNGMDFNMSYVDKCWHLWTTQDIKDGDILCTYECGKPKIIFILKGTPKKKPYVLRYHCYYNIMYPYFEPDAETGCLVVNDGDLKPATKEQCETLFEKMKLEGYKWDEDEKKIIRFERREESDFAFKENENGVIKFVHKKSKV